MHVTALYRYPVKSLTPEAVTQIVIMPDGRVRGDRAFAFRFAHVNPDDPREWLPKSNYASLQHIPELATLRTKFDDATGTLSIRDTHGMLDISGDPNDPAHRDAFSAEVSKWYASSESARRSRRPGAFRLVGDGSERTHQYHDTREGRTTLHSTASLDALAGALQVGSLSGVRFRSNIAIDGCEAWQEHAWRGRKLQIGSVQMRAIKPVVRCLATHANPETGERDADILNTLTRVIGQDEPQFAVSMTALNGGGTIRLGDAVQLLD